MMVKKECRLKGSAVERAAHSPKARSAGFSDLSKRCCKIKNGAVLSAVVKYK